MTTNTNAALSEAERLLRRDAESLREGHTSHRDRDDWAGEDDAKAGYEEYIRAADALAAFTTAAAVPASTTAAEVVEALDELRASKDRCFTLLGSALLSGSLSEQRKAVAKRDSGLCYSLVQEIRLSIDVAADVLESLAAAAPKAEPVPYSLDADHQGIRALCADAITGALAFGAQGINPPPEDHWLTPFWKSANADRAMRAQAAPAAVAIQAGDLLGIVRTAQAQVHRMIHGEDVGSDLAQTKRDLPETLRVIEHALSAPAAVAGPLHREWRSAVQEAIDTMEAEIDSREDAENVRRMKRAMSILERMLAAAPTTQAEPSMPEKMPDAALRAALEALTTPLDGTVARILAIYSAFHSALSATPTTQAAPQTAVQQGVCKRCTELEALSVTNILLDVVPDINGMGYEVYAKSVEDVEDRMTQMGQELEDWQLGIRRLSTHAAAPAAQRDAPDRPEPPRHLCWNELSDWLERHPLPNWLTPAQKYQYKYVGNIRARVGFEEWSRNEGSPVEMTSEGMYTGRLTAQNDWCVWLAACAANTPHQAPAAQGDAWRDLLWQIADALECTPCSADEVLPKVLAVAEDAMRYRWLRDPATNVALVIDKRTGYVPEDEMVLGVGGYHTYEYRAGDELDAAIDAARSQAKEGGA